MTAMSDRRPTMQDEADAQLKWIRENMTEAPAAPKQVWIWRDQPDDEFVVSVPDQPYPAGSPEYVRKDIAQAQIDAAVNAERERCAQVAETYPERAFGGGPWVDAARVAATIRKGEQP